MTLAVRILQQSASHCLHHPDDDLYQRIPLLRRCLVLGTTILFGMIATVVINGMQGGYDYRVSIAPWFRGVLTLQPDPSLIADAPIVYRLHALFGMLLFALWPFSRLVHAFSAPARYLIRPYVVYRSRGHAQLATRPARRGWDEH